MGRSHALLGGLALGVLVAGPALVVAVLVTAAPQEPAPVVRAVPVPAAAAQDVPKAPPVADPASAGDGTDEPEVPVEAASEGAIHDAWSALPAALRRMLLSSGLRIEPWPGDPLERPGNADLRGLPSFRGRAAFFLRMGNVVHVDASRPAVVVRRALLRELGAAVEHHGGALVTEAAFRRAAHRTGDADAADAPLGDIELQRRFADLFARWYGSAETRAALAAERPGAAAYLRDLERRVEDVDRWLRTVGSGRAARWARASRFAER